MMFSLAQKNGNRSPKIILALIAVGFLAGCSLFQGKNERACPKVATVASVGQVKQEGTRTEITNLAYECHYGRRDVALDIEISFAAKRDNVFIAHQVETAYFVAYVAPDDTILQKKTFPLLLRFKDKELTAGATEPVHLTLPLQNKNDSLAAYQILIGFQNETNAAP